MANKVKLIPVEGKRVRNPADGKVVSGEGIKVTYDQYWRKQVKEGSMLRDGEHKKKKKKKAKEPKPKMEEKKIEEKQEGAEL